MKLKPMKDKIVVKPYIRKLSDFLIVNNQERENMGQVVAVGPGRTLQSGRFEEMPIKVGAYVRFGTMNKDTGEEYLKYFPYFEDGVKYLVMSWQDICWEQEEPFTEEQINA